MKYTFFVAGMVAILGASTNFASAIVIDDFSDGDVLHTANSSQGWVFSLTNATVLGGDRGVQIRNNGLGTALAEVGGGRFGVSYPTDGFGISALIYGATSLIPGGAVYDFNANFDLSPNSALRFHFAGNDQPLEMYVRMVESDGVTSTTADYSKVIAGGQFSPFTVDIDDTDLFSGSPVWGQFDVMFISFDAADSGDFALTMIEAVPEPATLLALGGASALMLARRRRAKVQA